MGYAGTLKGVGAITAKNQRYANIPYDITVSSTPRAISGAGTIQVEDIAAAHAIFTTGNIILELQNGEEMVLVCFKYSPPSPYLEVSTSGAIPGY
jgi:hypothetical protein